MRRQKKESVGAPLPTIREESFDAELSSLYVLYQIEKELHQDRLDLVETLHGYGEQLQGYLERLERYLGQALRLLEAQGPVGKKALEELKRSCPAQAALIGTALRAVPLQ